MADYTETLDPRTRALIALGLTPVGETRAESVAGVIPNVQPAQAPVASPFSPNDLAESDPRALNTHPGLQPRVPPESPYALGNFIPEGTEGERFAELPDAREQLPPPARPAKMSPMQAAQYDEAQAIQEAGDTQGELARAQVAAQRQTITAQGAALQAHAEAKGQADLNYQTSRQLARQNAAVETAKWVQSMEDMAKREPNHQRYWQNQDSFGKSLWLLGMAFSGASQIGRMDAGMRPNPVLEMLQQEINKDIEAQKERLARERDTLKVKGDIMLRTQDQGFADLKDDHSMAWARLDALEKAAVLKASAPGTEADHAALLQGQAWIQQAKANIMSKRVERLDQAQQAALARAHQSSEAQKDRLLKLQLAQIEASAKVASTKAGPAMRGPYEAKDLRPIDMKGTGISVVDSKTGKVHQMIVHKDQHENFTKATQHYNSMYDGLKQARDIIASGEGDWETVFRNNPQLESLITQMGYQATDQLAPGDRKTDQDVQHGMRLMFGQNLDSLKGRMWSQISVDKDDVVKFLDRQLKVYPKKAQEALSHYLDTEIYKDDTSGELRTQFSPVSLAPTQEYEPTLEDEAKQAGVPAVPPQKIGSIYGLEKAENLEKVAPGSLPKYTKPGAQAEVKKLETQVQRMAPARIDDFADAAYEKVRGDDRAQAEILRIQRDAKAKNTEALTKVAHEGVWKTRESLIGYVKNKLGIQLNAYEGDAWLEASKAYWSTRGK